MGKRSVTWWVILVSLITGLIFTIISLLSVCSESCKEAHDYVFFGFSLDILGLLFFSTTIIAHLLGAYPLVSLMLAGGVGAELIFILIQYEVIGQWCPICLSIAATVFLAASVLTLNYLKETIQKIVAGEWKMFSLQIVKGCGTLFILILGFGLALFGVVKPEKGFAQGTSENEDPIFGNKQSSIEIYVISDWFCEACKDIEPKLEKIVSKASPHARIFFIDRNIHPESMNYMPFNLSFMLKEKPKYLKIRKALVELTKKTTTPTALDVQRAVAPLGVTYKPLNFADIDSGHRFFQGISETFKVDSTPTVVIANKKTIKAKKLVGSEEINDKNILFWIEKLS